MELGVPYARKVARAAAVVAAAVRNFGTFAGVSTWAISRAPASQAGSMATWIRLPVWTNALRVHQWAKNALAFVPLLTSHQFSKVNLSRETLLIAKITMTSVC